jgi:hypothetical protein
MEEQLSTFLRTQEALIANMIKQQQDSLTAQMKQLEQKLQDRIDDHHIANDTPATTAYSAQPAAEHAHGRQKMKMKLEYDHSNPALFPAFDSQLEAKLRIDGPVIGTEVEQVWFGFGCLKGIASARIHPWVKAFQNDVTRFTKVNFFNQMRRAFADPEAQNKALQKLGYMKQGHKDFREFISEFDQTLLEAGAFGESESTKKSWLRNAISLDLAKAIVAAPEPETYEELCQQLHRVSHQLTSLSKRTPTRLTTRQPQTISYTAAPPDNATHKPDAMDWEPSLNKRRAKWVSKGEIDKRMQENRCRRCGASGHFVNRCPYPPRPPANFPKAASAKVVGPELEAEEVISENQGKE